MSFFSQKATKSLNDEVIWGMKHVTFKKNTHTHTGSYLWQHDKITWEPPARAAACRVSTSSSTWRRQTISITDLAVSSYHCWNRRNSAPLRLCCSSHLTRVCTCFTINTSRLCAYWGPSEVFTPTSRRDSPPLNHRSCYNNLYQSNLY